MLSAKTSNSNPFIFIIGKWRKGWDLNPRIRKRITPLAGVRIQPLCHLSLFISKKMAERQGFVALRVRHRFNCSYSSQLNSASWNLHSNPTILLWNSNIFLLLLFFLKKMAERQGFVALRVRHRFNCSYSSQLNSASWNLHSNPTILLWNSNIFLLLLFFLKKMAERQGFEPWVPQVTRRFSRPLPSTTQPSLHVILFIILMNSLKPLL